jgi:hypothetical protein
MRTLVSISASLLLAGCSFVSGYRDLQGGTRDSAKDGGGTNTPPPPPPPGDDAGPPPPLACGSVQCASGQICCETNKLACSTKDLCNSDQGNVLECTENLSCTGGNLCCLDSAALASSCKKTCDLGNGESVLCRPQNAAKDCFPGQTCTSLGGASNLFQCQ